MNDWGVIAVMHVQIDVEGKNYIEANYCTRRGIYYGIHLHVGEDWSADNERWLFQSFLPFLKRFKKQMLTVEDKKFIKDFDLYFVTCENVRSFLKAFKLFKKMTKYKVGESFNY